VKAKDKVVVVRVRMYASSWQAHGGRHVVERGRFRDCSESFFLRINYRASRGAVPHIALQRNVIHVSLCM